jgi:hypothetical protein
MKKGTRQRLKNLNNRLNVRNSRLLERMIHRPATQLCFWLICIAISVASIEPSKATELSAVFGNDTLSMNGVVIGEISEGRARLALPALVQALGTPDRSQVQGHTRRITWDNEGIQLETTDQESTAFAILFEFAKPDAVNQGIIPAAQYRGTFDCLGIELHPDQPLPDRIRILAAAGFSKESGSNAAETWSVRLEHWAVFLRFSAAGTIDSAVIRVLPDIF